MTPHPFPPPPGSDRPEPAPGPGRSTPPAADHLPPPPRPAPSGCAGTYLWRIIAITTAIIFVVVGLAVIGVLILISTGRLTIWSNK